MKHFFSFCIFFSVLSHAKCFKEATAPGDIIIGGLFPIHESVKVSRSADGSDNRTCDRFSTARLVQSLIMVHAVEEINQRHELGNLTLGYRIQDSCSDVTTALKNTLSFMRRNCDCDSEGLAVNTSRNGAPQQSSPPVLAVIGEYHSETSIAVTRQLNLEYIPQISYGSTSGFLSDKIRFPSFMRTVPEDDHQVQAIITVLTSHQWTWVGVVSTDGDYGRYAVERLRRHATNNNICFAFTAILPDALHADTVHDSINSTIQSITENENVKVIVSFAKPYHMMYLFRRLLKDPRGRGKVWVASDNWSQSADVLDTKNWDLSDVGTVFGITLKSGNTTKFKRYLRNLDVNPDRHKNNPFLYNFLKQQQKIDSASQSSMSGDTATQALINMIYPYAVFSVELAVKAIAQAIADLCTDRDCKTTRLHPLELREALRNATFYMDGKNYSFDERGDLNSGYDIILWQQTSPAFLDVKNFVAHYSIENQSLTFKSQKAYQDVDAVTGSVISRCSTSCDPGFRKKSADGQPVCCYQCHPCPENHFSNISDSTECHQCNAATHYSPQNSSTCLLKKTVFLNWNDQYHIVLLTFTALGAVLTLVVGLIFLACWNTPVVRSSVGPICILLLFSLLSTFVSVIIFGGKPNKWQCQARQVAFGLSFTLCVSCILVKSLKIILAFEFDPSTKRILEKLYKPYIIIAACMAGQVLICTLWLVFKPPEPKWETQKNKEERLMFCHENLYPAFGAMLSYIGFLALICFGVAFKGRKLPHCYRDAKFITFAMLIYFISWIIFGPVYVNVTSRYLPAVEMVVILISAYGILFCQFFTKCYIILFKQEANTETAFRQEVRNYSLGQDGDRDGDWISPSLGSHGIQNPALSMESLSNSLSSDPLTDRRISMNSDVSVFTPSPVSKVQPTLLQNSHRINNKQLQRYFSLPASVQK